MLHIILAILKIICIVIAIVLGVVLLLVLGILFVPIRYSSKGQFDETVNVSATISFMLHILHFNVRYNDKKPKYVLRVFGIPVFSSEKKRRKADIAKPKQKIKQEEPKEGKAEEEQAKLSTKTEECSDNTVKNVSADDQSESEDETVQSICQKIKTFINAVINKINAIPGKIKTAVEKIKNIIKKIREIWNFIQDDTTKTAVLYIKQNMFNLLRHYSPKKIFAVLKYGFGSPDVTGRVFGYISIVCGILGKKAERLSVKPDFDNQVLEGSYRFKGRIRLCHFVIAFIKLIMKKEIRITYKRVKKEI